eukprot:366501-Chlamydomonas_euryale.AAC.41
MVRTGTAASDVSDAFRSTARSGAKTGRHSDKPFERCLPQHHRQRRHVVAAGGVQPLASST